MTTHTSPPQWLGRLLRVGSVALALVAVALWVTPQNARGRNLIPVGCGSPATPDTARLTDFICRDHLSTTRFWVVALLVSAALLLLLSEVVLPRVAARPWLTGASTAAVLGVPAFALAAVSLFTSIADEGSDGTLVRCGTAIAPANDAISRALCADRPARQKSLALFGMGLSTLTVLGAAHVARGTSTHHEGTGEDDA